MFKHKLIFFITCLLFFGKALYSQSTKDTIYLMNGKIVPHHVYDTLLGAVTIIDTIKNKPKRIHYEWDQLYMVRYSNGFKRFYYEQDSLKHNWFTRDEMWMFMKGERDAHKGFTARGALIGSGICGIVGGMAGSFFSPILPYSFLALCGLPKVRIKAKTISNPAYVESDGYILGYERVARQKRRIQSVIGGTCGLVIGFGLFGILHNYYPSQINIGQIKIQ
ncbi:MAG: hypothetical protein JSU07_07935 [Bacteroidetes bacterium]|nr:hypothetical protein [Bacteroidota bacterium]